MDVFSDTNTMIRLISHGTALWTPGGIFETSCEADVTYYPMDTQTCRYVNRPKNLAINLNNNRLNHKHCHVSENSDHNHYNLFTLTIEYGKNFTTTQLLTIELMALFMVKSIHIQINGQVYGSISCKLLHCSEIFTVIYC